MWTDLLQLTGSVLTLSRCSQIQKMLQACEKGQRGPASPLSDRRVFFVPPRQRNSIWLLIKCLILIIMIHMERFSH